ncbi:DUF2235 domain-containing protein [Jannaschia rubra]|uniref:T6SS Phospholipase effector Tle1-like catalytic domain-containing protein n=1 Tax=Jannaschia rubra TaxID=282197 RepID=A0A0M6XSV2_9RHOB|nr:DUF2235 domain-containing protein [Jannaschia rubra]CTQ34190.1 hypothetical protein JAN5088_02983 [Jannaschia rubra]SFG21033.1 Uncharacterized protein, PA2063/DUF2235 family [Jannaschia rubra]
MPLNDFLRRIWRRGDLTVKRPEPSSRTHVVLLDGTMSSLVPGRETSIGLIYRLLDADTDHNLYYEPGIEWRGWRHVAEIMAGVGINHQIRRAYAFLATHYRPGDRVFVLGYSRGAYGVRALAGMIDRVGLLLPENVDDAMVHHAYDHYRGDPTRPEARSFTARYCQPRAGVTAVGVFDTVQAVGIRSPLLWRLFPQVHAFRSHRLGRTIEHGFHAMALDETRMAYALDRWRTNGTRTASVEQVWFRGTHGDLGGQLGGAADSRPLSNIPLVWLLSRLQSVGLDLPDGWQDRFPTDATAPSVGNWRGFGAVFLARRRRVVGLDASESLHLSAADHRASAVLRIWAPRRAAEAAE